MRVLVIEKKVAKRYGVETSSEGDDNSASTQQQHEERGDEEQQSTEEQPLLGNDKSVWQERGLLRECEKQGTSFRLLICCAQKPLQPRRRTKSV